MGLFLLAGPSGEAVADPHSDLFQPDAFRTGAALAHRVPGLEDPLADECPPPSGTLSLKAAVDLGLCRNPSTRSAWASARQQAAVYGSAESAWLPSISGTASEVRTSGGEHVDALGDVVPNVQNTRDAAVSLTWTLYDFGGREAHINNARHLLDAAAASLNRTTQQVVMSIAQAYYGVVAGDALLAAARITEGVSQRSLDLANGLRTGGVATLADVLQAETAYNQAVLARIQAELTAETARGSLSVAVGFTADEPIKLEAETVPPEVQPLSSHLSDLMEEAMRQRPDLAAAQAQRDAAASEVTVARAVGRPTISIQGGHDLSDSTGIPNQRYNQIGIYLTVPIFTGFNVAYGVRQAQAQLAGQEATAEQVRLQVSQDVWNAYYSFESGNQQLSATAKLVKIAQDNQEVAVGRYKSGVGSILDVLTAQTAASDARQVRINAELAWKVARAQLALSLGRLTNALPLTAGAVAP